MGIVRDLYYARKMGAGLKLPAPSVALLIKRLALSKILSPAVLKTVTGALLHITDALAKPAVELLCDLSPIQSLNGYTSPWPAGGGKNLCSMQNESFTQTKDVEIDEIPAGSYTYSAVVTSTDTDASVCVIAFLGANSTVLVSKSVQRSTGGSRVSTSFTVSAPIKYIRMYASSSWPASQDDTATFADNMIESGSTPTSYTPYSNICPISGRTGLSVYVSPTQNQADATTYSSDWTSVAGTVYGGSLDVVTGVLTSTMANIASYNGETITEPWLSSMDAYVSGATPTTGAQVVYTLATPLTYQLTAQEVDLLLGENYLWRNDSGDLQLTYYADGNANTEDALNLLLGNRYVNNHTPEDVSDREALDILLGR